MTKLFHITEAVCWQTAQTEGLYRAESLQTQGFIHLSEQSQVQWVGNQFYRGQTGLALLEIDSDRLTSELRYDVVPCDGTFPHLYGPLNLDAVVQVWPFTPSKTVPEQETPTKEQPNLQIWVDADACPNPIKEILYRAAKRVGILTTLVANQELQISPSPYIKAVQVRLGLDVADSYIVEQLNPGDLVITADIPLAAEAIAKGAVALNPRGEFYNEGNIRERLSLRNFMDELRSGGVDTGGPPTFSQRDRQNFANQLDQFLNKQTR
jgi:uncharacterized protein